MQRMEITNRRVSEKKNERKKEERREKTTEINK